MHIHDFATLLVLAAQNPQGLVYSYTVSGSIEHCDHARCLVRHINQSDGDQQALFGADSHWRLETREPCNKECDVCDVMGGFTEWTS